MARIHVLNVLLSLPHKPNFVDISSQSEERFRESFTKRSEG